MKTKPQTKMKKPHLKNRMAWPVLTALALGVVSAGAQTSFTNVVNANGNWTNPAVWVGGVAPVAGGAGGDRAQLSGTNGNVWVTGDVGSAGTRQVLDFIGNTGVNATLTISNGTFYHTGYASDRNLQIGFAATGNGGRLILDGGNFDTDRSSATGTRIGNNAGNGLLEVRNGNFTTSGGIQMANNNSSSTTAQGTLRITGANASANVGAAIQLGGSSASNVRNGQATVEVLDGGVLTSSSLFSLDALSATRGTNATTGSTPNARLVVDGGYFTNSGTVRLGRYTNSRATIDVSGGGVFQARRIETDNTAFNAQKLLTFNVSNGTLRVSELSLLDAQLNNGGALTIGDGTSASALELLGSENAIVVTNGIAIAANSELRHATATNATVASAISGAGAVVKSGTGTLTLSAANSYTGTTTVSGGSLIVNGDQSSATGAVSILAGGTLGGSGTIGGATTISGTHAPGNSPGIQTFSSDLTYNAANVEWDLTANTTVQGNPTPVFDQIVVGGGLDFATPTTLSLRFNFTGSSVDWSNSLWSNNITGTSGWLLYDVAGTLSNFGNLSITTENWADVNGALFNTELAGSSFSLYQAGNDIYLNYAVPEPSTYAMLVLAGVGLAAHVIRRRRSH